MHTMTVELHYKLHSKLMPVMCTVKQHWSGQTLLWVYKQLGVCTAHTGECNLPGVIKEPISHIKEINYVWVWHHIKPLSLIT